MEAQTVTEAVKMLSAEEILAADDRPEMVVEVPEWGGSVKIKALSLGQFRDVQEKAEDGVEQDEHKLAIAMLKEGLVEPKLSDEQAEKLYDKAIPAVTKVLTAIAELSDVDPATVKAAEARFPDEG